MATEGTCQTCGALWRTSQQSSNIPSFFFSSTSKAKGSYATASDILTLGESILTCPLDPITPKSSEGRSPAGARMQAGDDRMTSGDESTIVRQ